MQTGRAAHLIIAALERALIGAINIYRKVFSNLMLPSCRCMPSCSQYALESLQRFGLIGASLNIVKRLLRCHPFSRTVYDPAR